MTRPLMDYLSVPPWEALLQLVNDNCGLDLKPHSTTLMSLESISEDGETKVTLTAPRTDNTLRPPFAYRVFKYYRLNLAEVFSDFNGGFIDPDSTVVDTRWVLKWLFSKTGIKFGINDCQHTTVKNMETFTLKAHPMSLRWYGEITMTIASSIDNAHIDEPGTYKLRLKPGTYSLLMVGGGSGGTGRQFSVEDSSLGHLMLSAGGGSGHAVKTRISVNDGDSITVTVGAGGPFYCPDEIKPWASILEESINNADSRDGGDSYVVQNKKEIARAKGAHVSGRYTGPKSWTYYSKYVASGGCGASGGGRSGTFKGAYYVTDKLATFDPGTEGGDGGSDGDHGHELNVGSDGTPWATLGSGGIGTGKGYYTNLLNSIDPEVTHGIDYGSVGGKAVSSQVKMYSGETLLGTTILTRAGGGGGLGISYQGKTVLIDGVNQQLDGSGYGAGGGGGNPGVAGFVSLVKLS